MKIHIKSNLLLTFIPSYFSYLICLLLQEKEFYFYYFIFVLGFNGIFLKDGNRFMKHMKQPLKESAYYTSDCWDSETSYVWVEFDGYDDPIFFGFSNHKESSGFKLVASRLLKIYLKLFLLNFLIKKRLLINNPNGGH